MTIDSHEAPGANRGTNDTCASLAREHEAAVLAAALVARLRADGRADLAGALVALLSGEAAGILNPNPPDPHRAEDVAT
jgi:hypothetical protein